MFTIFLLRKSNFTQHTLDLYNIRYSTLLRHFISFNPDIQYWYPRAVLGFLEFGDLACNPEKLEAFRISLKKLKITEKPHGWAHGATHGPP